MMNELQVKTNGIKLQVREHEQEGDAIIFLHFSGANLMMWQRAVPYFQDAYRLLLIDLRGHGRSHEPETGYHMDEMAHDVIGVMDHLNLSQAHVVGSSLGAEVGLSMAANYPDRVISLVCDGALANEYGPYGTWEGSEPEFEEHVTNRLEKLRSSADTYYPSVKALLAERQALFEKYGWWNTYLEAMERYGIIQNHEGKVRKSFGKQATAEYMEHYYHYRLEDYYRRVQCPVLMLAEKDAEDERETAVMHALQQLAPQAQIAEISGWAHPYCWFLHPEDACKAIRQFLPNTDH